LTTLRHKLGNLHHPRAGLLAIVLILTVSLSMNARSQASSQPVELDHVVAVVNNRAILYSDVQEEMRVSILEPNIGQRGAETPQEALQRLISRTLIRQQIRQEDAVATTPSPADVTDRINLLRKELPVCILENCSTDAGWSAFLARHGLTDDAVRRYMRSRLGILRFIEMRFRQGIQISHEEVETYYRDKLVPQYPSGQVAPPLDQVAPRIQEILLQQQVSAMFSGWLENLRKQGEIEVVDPSLEAAVNPAGNGTGAK